MTGAIVYVTCSSRDEAEKILLDLLEKRWVACGNILPEVTSYYHWNGKIEQSAETVLLLKTESGRFAAIEQRIVDLHSYEIPCIIRLQADDVHEPYAKWLSGELV